MSYTVVLLPILSVLSIANNMFLAPGQSWQTVNKKQEFFTQTYWPLKTQLNLLTQQELSSIVSKDVDVVNAFLKEKGFTIKLEPLLNDYSVAIASVLDVLLKWKEKGNEDTFFANKTQYPAVLMRTGSHCAVKALSDNQKILVIETENNETVYLQPVTSSKPLLKEFDLIEYIKTVTAPTVSETLYYDEVLFPMIDLNEQVNIKWLLDLELNEYFIRQALQQTKFQMNEEGVAAQSAVAVEVALRCCVDRTNMRFTLDKPFYLWVMRKGIDIPVFAAYLDYDAWKKPANLGGK